MSFLSLVQFNDISKSFGSKQVLSHISFSISKSEKLALIGENGTGKTTLARLIAGYEFPDEGKIILSPDCKIGYLPQSSDNMSSDLTVNNFLLDSQQNLYGISIRLKELEDFMGAHSTKQDFYMSEWDSLFNQFESCGGYSAIERHQVCLSALKIENLSEKKIKQLSGGERRRVCLASLLLQDFDLLILDEPTNHLDHSAIEWLEIFLKEYKGAVLMISHDRHFLNRTSQGILELSSDEITYYSGNYDDYLFIKQHLLSKRLEAYEKQQEEITALKLLIKEKSFSSPNKTMAKDSNKMAYDRRGEKHVNSQRKIISQAKGRLQSIEKLKHPILKQFTGIIFRPKDLRDGPVLKINDIDLEMAGRLLVKSFSGVLHSKERIIINGPNGCGKSTFLRLLSEKENPLNAVFSSDVVIGYLDQDCILSDQNLTLLEYLQKRFRLPEHQLRSRLQQIALIENRFIKQRVSTLSLGQKRRLQLLEIILSEANLLLLDEPTNHLAPQLIDQLEQALQSFSGAVLIATHDRQFSKRVGTDFWNFPQEAQG